MAEQLLDDAQVGAAVEQMGRERVAQRVRRDAGRQPGRPAQPIEPVAQPADAERATRVVQEDLGRFGGPGRIAIEQDRAAVVEVGGQRRDRRPSQQPDALLAALADDPELAAAEVERAEVRGRELADPQAGGVGGLDERPVAQRERRGQRDPVRSGPVSGGQVRVDDAEQARRPGRPRGRAAGGAAGAASRWHPTGRRRRGPHGPPSDGTSGSRRGAGRPSSATRTFRAGRGRRAGRPAPARPSRPRALDSQSR